MQRGDENELERYLRLEEVKTGGGGRKQTAQEERRGRLENDAATKRLRLAMEKKKKSKTGEDGSYHRAHVSSDERCGRCGCGFVPQTHSEKLTTEEIYIMNYCLLLSFFFICLS